MKDNSAQAGSRRFPRIEVNWKDARVRGGWRDLKEYQASDLASCTAIGYRIKQDRDVVILVQQLGLANDVSDAVIIPRSCIRRIRRLKV